MTYGFFSRIRSQLKEDIRGRYLAFILRELITAEPKVVNALIREPKDVPKSPITVDLEWSFKEGRRADLALFFKDRVAPAALLEIKYGDEKTDGVSAQLEDYVTYAKENDCLLGVITAYPLKEKDANYLADNNLHSILLREVADRLRQDKHTRENPLVTLFLDYVKEEGFMFDNDIGTEDIKKLLVRLVMPRNSGAGRIRGKENILSVIPDTFRGLISNMQVITTYLDPLRKNATQVPLVDFSIDPWIDPWIYSRQAETSDESRSLLDKEKAGGYLWTYTAPKIYGVPDKEWLFVEMGLSYGLFKEENKLAVDAYCKIWGKVDGVSIAGGDEGNGYYNYSEKQIKMPNDYKPECLAKILRECFSKSSKLALDGKLPAKASERIRCLRKDFELS
jgi:hypothetical protein